MLENEKIGVAEKVTSYLLLRMSGHHAQYPLLHATPATQHCHMCPLQSILINVVFLMLWNVTICIVFSFPCQSFLTPCNSIGIRQASHVGHLQDCCLLCTYPTIFGRIVSILSVVTPFGHQRLAVKICHDFNFSIKS